MREKRIDGDRAQLGAKLSHGQAFSFLIQPRSNCSTRVSGSQSKPGIEYTWPPQWELPADVSIILWALN